MKDALQIGRMLAPPLPNSFAGIMEMYEANYIRLRKLCGSKELMPIVAVSRVTKGMDLYLQVIEQTRYTSMLTMTYFFSDDKISFIAYPDLRLRIYYDALQAEVISQSYRRNNHRFKAFNHAKDPSLLKRWRMNRFLFKWLSYLDHQGHSFRSDDRSRQNQLITKNVEIPLQVTQTSSNIV